MRKLLILFILGVAAYFAIIDGRTPPRAEQHAVSAVAEQRVAPSSIERGVSRTHPTFDTADNGKQVMTQGTVCRILDDDNEGRRHQRFLIELKSGQTILIAGQSPHPSPRSCSYTCYQSVSPAATHDSTGLPRMKSSHRCKVRS